jgi:hypothetical protein
MAVVVAITDIFYLNSNFCLISLSFLADLFFSLSMRTIASSSSFSILASSSNSSTTATSFVLSNLGVLF